MIVQEGYFYHIKDSFYQEVNDKTLMSNKEDGGYRPRFGQPATIAERTGKEIIKCLKSNLALHRRGVNLFFADIDRIYSLMECKLQN